MEQQEKKTTGKRIWGIVSKCLIVLLETVLLAVIGLYCAMFILVKGPSTATRDLFVLTVRETSAAGFLANLYFTEAEIEAIVSSGTQGELEDTDTSLIEIPSETAPSDEQQGPVTDAWGLVDSDGDGIIVETVRSGHYTGYMMVVLDPSRVVMGARPEEFGVKGYTVQQQIKQHNAVAGINGGGFVDPQGQGDGSIPNTMVVYDGEIYYPEKGVAQGFVGIDDKHILHVGYLSAADIKAKNIRYGVGFGPALVSNGKPVETKASGLNPRTGIGQRSDGAMLLLVIDGRQTGSLGATYEDMTEVFLSYGAVNACNLDGGSSSIMWYQGDYINNNASLVGIRPMPTTFLVLKEGQNEE